MYTEVAASEVVHGVKAEDETPMAETMMAVAKALEAQGGTTITRIVNIDKIILPEEMAALEVLSVREQLLTFLSVIGFEEQVNAAMAADADGLSAEAVALKEQIQSRIAAMDAAAYAAFEAALLESFPRRRSRSTAWNTASSCWSWRCARATKCATSATASAWRTARGSSPAWRLADKRM